MLKKLECFLGVLFHGVYYFVEKCRTKYLSQRYKKFGVDIKLNGVGVIACPENLLVGKNIHIGKGYHIDARGGVEIGDNTHFSRNTVIYSVSHEFDGDRVPYDESLRKKRVIIGRNVWVGMNVIILPGADIGEGAIIGAGAVVAGKVEPCGICVAESSKTIKKRNEDKYFSNCEKGRFGGVNGGEI